MTDRTGARWASAAFIAPAAAAVFAGSMAWAAGHQPQTTTPTKTSATPAGDASASAQPDPRVAQVAKLQKQVAALRTELEELEASSGKTSSGKSSGGKSSGGKSTRPRRPVPPKPPRDAAPPPPPTDTSTGAS